MAASEPTDARSEKRCRENGERDSNNSAQRCKLSIRYRIEDPRSI
jgi:hypothetical protein